MARIARKDHVQEPRARREQQSAERRASHASGASNQPPSSQPQARRAPCSAVRPAAACGGAEPVDGNRSRAPHAPGRARDVQRQGEGVHAERAREIEPERGGRGGPTRRESFGVERRTARANGARVRQAHRFHGGGRLREVEASTSSGRSRRAKRSLCRSEVTLEHTPRGALLSGAKRRGQVGSRRIPLPRSSLPGTRGSQA